MATKTRPDRSAERPAVDDWPEAAQDDTPVPPVASIAESPGPGPTPPDGMTAVGRTLTAAAASVVSTTRQLGSQYLDAVLHLDPGLVTNIERGVHLFAYSVPAWIPARETVSQVCHALPGLHSVLYDYGLRQAAGGRYVPADPRARTLTRDIEPARTPASASASPDAGTAPAAAPRSAQVYRFASYLLEVLKQLQLSAELFGASVDRTAGQPLQQTLARPRSWRWSLILTFEVVKLYALFTRRRMLLTQSLVPETDRAKARAAAVEVGAAPAAPGAKPADAGSISPGPGGVSFWRGSRTGRVFPVFKGPPSPGALGEEPPAAGGLGGDTGRRYLKELARCEPVNDSLARPTCGGPAGRRLDTFGLVIEVLHALRPLLYVALMTRSLGRRSAGGRRSALWQAWALSALLEVSCLLVHRYRAGAGRGGFADAGSLGHLVALLRTFFQRLGFPASGGVPLPEPVSNGLDALVPGWDARDIRYSEAERQELDDRQGRLIWWLLREPAFSSGIGSALSSLGAWLSDKPLIGFTGGLVQDYLAVWRNSYYETATL
ncbi:hypothetical protein H696_04807 [Fonticula alba]|uniref:Peroxisomal membrane protein PEX16 n=1 Tax=Fonticula alba TaxID=691883 RepID=A0A058Z2Q0_FONAL|nr:hypothetical protein H696_04807 [Fonticula alba]KCV68515.1 hypothetical protein H696_04807 [Fonticula alba]|eukprot:XP_009496947.1 hypothetical protein H696_04807 [Fonticula alba]